MKLASLDIRLAWLRFKDKSATWYQCPVNALEEALQASITTIQMDTF